MSDATDSLSPLQAALYERLTGDTQLSGLLATRGGPKPLTGVYDGVPESAQYPLIDLGEAVETPRNSHGAFGSEVVATLHVWTKSDGFKSGLAIVSRLRELLDHQPLTVTGLTVVSVRHEMTQTLRDPKDSKLRHLPVRFRLTNEQE